MQIFRSHAYFRGKPRPFRSFLRPTTSSMDLFSNRFLLKYSKVSHSNSFLSSVARKGRGVPFSLTSVYFLVLGAAQRGVPVHPWIPLWIRHCPGVWHVRLAKNFVVLSKLYCWALQNPGQNFPKCYHSRLLVNQWSCIVYVSINDPRVVTHAGPSVHRVCPVACTKAIYYEFKHWSW